MHGLLAHLNADSALRTNVFGSNRVIAPAASNPFLIALTAQEKPVLVVTSSSRGAEDVAEDLRNLHPLVYEFPAWETLPHERLSPRSDTVAKRIQTLAALAATPKDANPTIATAIKYFCMFLNTNITYTYTLFDLCLDHMGSFLFLLCHIISL